MKTIRKSTQTAKLWFMLTIQAFLFPISGSVVLVHAQEAPLEETQTTTDSVPPAAAEEPAPVVPPVTTPGPQEPTGPENTTYTYNPETGLWENPYYTWNPATKKTTPKTEQDYSYNPATGRWDTKNDVYSPETGTYIPRPVSNPAPSNEPNSSSILKPQAIATPQNKYVFLGDADSPNGPGSLSVINYDSNKGAYFDNFFDANISVNVRASANSGNASVLQNTVGGSALTGNASSSASIMNLVQSMWGAGGVMPNMFTENIQGNYYGDIVLDPGMLAVSNSSQDDELVVNSTADVAIVNNIDLNAESGDALVSSNTEAGDAVSGDASAVLNLMNIINSSISAGQSFVGMLNIHGNFEGDVLMAGSVTDQLIASNIPTAQVNLSQEVNNDIMIDNNINATSSSGDATVTNNTSAGSAISGDATSNVTVFNLTGSHVIAEQAMLVFVNVQGEWIGFITNAPEGSNAAMLGSGISSNSSLAEDTEINVDNKSAITNNVTLSAATGSASVTNNTTAGGATTGNASTAANIVNIANSSLSMSNWFGMLFINIFGNWSGSFGTDTAFGDTVTETPGQNNTYTGSSSSSSLTANSSAPQQGVRVFAITSSPNSSGGTSITSATPVLEEDVPPQTVLSENDENKKVAAILGDSDSNPPSSSAVSPFILLSIAAGVIATAVYRRRLATA